MPLAYFRILTLSLAGTTVLALPLLNFSQLSVVHLLTMLFVMTLSLSIHEYAHAWMAYRLGDDTAALAGRLTLNPLRHLDPIGSLTFLLVGIGWARPVPINPSRFTRVKSVKRGLFLTSLAGPMANILLGTIAWIFFCVVYTIYLATGASGAMTLTLINLFTLLFSLNMLLAVFNLLPIPPLDGYRVFGVALPDRWHNALMAYERYIGMAFFFLVIFLGRYLFGFLGLILVPFNYAIQYPITWLFQQLQSALGLPQMPLFVG